MEKHFQNTKVEAPTEPGISGIGQFVSSIGFRFCLILGILSYVFGFILALGPSEWIVNGRRKMVDEPLIGYGLLGLAGFFTVYAVMFLVAGLAVSISTNRHGTPWFYSFSIGLAGLVAALYFFIQKIGFTTTVGILICSALVIASAGIASFLIYYIHSIATPFKRNGKDSLLKMKAVDNNPNSFNNQLANGEHNGNRNINIQVKLF